MADLPNTAGPAAVLAVSPHLDDALLSAGATLELLAAGGVQVHVLTVFAGDAPDELGEVAARHHQRCGLGPAAVADRRAEDQAACAELGLVPHHGAHRDVVYRRDAFGEWLCRRDGDMFAAVSDPAGSRAPSACIEKLVVEVQPAAVLAPLGVGQHVDHVLTRAAAERVAARHDLPLGLWVDVPYAMRAGVQARDCTAIRVPITPGKVAAVAHYCSQLSMLWPDRSASTALSGWLKQIYWSRTCPTSDLIDSCMRGSP